MKTFSKEQLTKKQDCKISIQYKERRNEETKTKYKNKKKKNIRKEVLKNYMYIPPRNMAPHCSIINICDLWIQFSIYYTICVLFIFLRRPT